jgi:hypothetical protein
VIYAGGRRCFKVISITRKPNGRIVVDECDTRHSACKGNIVDTSTAMWKALGLDSNISEVLVIPLIRELVSLAAWHPSRSTLTTSGWSNLLCLSLDNPHSRFSEIGLKL